MAKKPRRDLTVEEQLARGPVDMPFLMLVVLLTVVGVIMVFSASYAVASNDAKVAKNDPAYYFIRQAVFAAAGLAAMFIISKINYQTFRWMSVAVLGVSIVLLILVLPFGYGRDTVGAQRWLRIPVAGSIQPSEVAKVGVIMYFSARMSKRRQGLDTPKKRRFSPRRLPGRIGNFLDSIGFLELIPYILVLAVVCGLMLLEPHMSGTILVLVGAAAVLFAGGINLGWFAAGGAVIAAGLAFIITKTDYMSMRIQLWKDPWFDGARGKGYQLIQSLYAIGSGGLMGVGFGRSRQKLLYLPEPENDFIFPIICEELGLIGACLILLLFALLIIRGYWIAIHARDRFGALMVVGVITLLATQVFLNVAVVTNLIPTTGISLPFFSYGGSALMIQLAEMGMVLSISRQIPAPRQG